MAEPIKIAGPDRRKLERRDDPTLSELTLPELRRMMVTTMLFVIILVLFLWMVRTVIIATILGVIVAMYMRPVYLHLLRFVPNRIASATFTLLMLIGPVLAVSIYSYREVADVAAYASVHRDEIATRIDQSLHQVPFLQSADTKKAVQHFVLVATDYGTNVLGHLRSALASLAVAATIFVFTAYYVMVDADEIVAYVRQRIPPRYGELAAALEINMRGVLYGAIYSTFLTQAMKSVIILAMNLAFHVPLAGVLAILSFVIGFFPIVGSWSVYVPVAIWLVIFRDAVGSAIAMIVIGTLVNTVFISTYLRPKIAAERSKVLNFYWMFVALITGVYTFGLAGILLGPILIGLLKAVIDTVTARSSWQILELDDVEDAPAMRQA